MGKLYTCSLSKLKDYDAKYKYFIVRYPKGVSVDGLIHMPELAPSGELLSAIKQQQHDNVFTIENYKDRLLAELADNEDAISAVDDIGIKLDSGDDVLLVCFCGDPNICHRKILAEVFSANGYDVEVN